MLATPHIAGVTDLAYEGIARCVADNITRLVEKRQLQNCVNWSEIVNRPAPDGPDSAAVNR